MLRPIIVALSLIAVAGGSLGCSTHAKETAESERTGGFSRRMPAIKDPTWAQKIVERHYPKEFKGIGIGGQVDVWIFVDVDGTVKQTRIKKSSGYEQLDAAAMAALREIKFIPARHESGKIVPVWVSIPITFSGR